MNYYRISTTKPISIIEQTSKMNLIFLVLFLISHKLGLIVTSDSKTFFQDDNHYRLSYD